ncbi:MAG: hypothetical protein ACOYU4_09400 [Thermodesulfobacteriota bacterium]
MKTLIFFLSLFFLSTVAYATPTTYYYSGYIFGACTDFSPSSPFDDLVGQAFSGSFTYEADTIDSYISGLTNYYPASYASFHISATSFVNFSYFDWPPLGISSEDLFLSADSSTTQGHIVDWGIGPFDANNASINFLLSFMGAPSPQFLFEGLKKGSLENTDFSNYGVTIFVNGEPYPVASYLHLQVYDATGGNLQYHNIYGDITHFSTTPIPEPASAYLILSIIPLLLSKRLNRTMRSN